METFSYKPKDQPRVVRRKLGRYLGWYHPDTNLIEVDERLKGKKELIIYLHEYFHKLFPDIIEDEIIIRSEAVADFLWKHGYRKVDFPRKTTDTTEKKGK
jgi:hypothetical protein